MQNCCSSAAAATERANLVAFALRSTFKKPLLWKVLRYGKIQTSSQALIETSTPTIPNFKAKNIDRFQPMMTTNGPRAQEQI